VIRAFQTDKQQMRKLKDVSFSWLLLPRSVILHKPEKHR
jgi:hypothetical protein